MIVFRAPVASASMHCLNYFIVKSVVFNNYNIRYVIITRSVIVCLGIGDFNAPRVIILGIELVSYTMELYGKFYNIERSICFIS